ncbi:low-specificity L-threonine aldolase [Salipaludibacillus agaradhaerens]|uniref:Low-specificity L-threonine aldolase n=1 Tax=Salipaludibacillus agaradhaerens TaxID=76935 RepID=A0A9Q4FY77_SALAG|nr:low-specificity L-threonine aldolase [Salipaludibacillus agaradhaerens]MCR6095449.1 low-specificity L-threonine aldolase [Salipaludibacillus agaradhaerens]MCR6114991.1 low-specificity L-threonine aldolase [Salipaludibacillus agaradhaerens]
MIDLRSDTVTKPSQLMRDVMAKADVGDDVYGEDPTVNELEAYAAKLVGKEAALFVTSGTQGNQIAVLSHTHLGQEVIMDEDAHVFVYEGGAISAFAGVQSRTLPHVNGEIPLKTLEESIQPDDVHFPETGLIWLENTHNRSGGTVLTIDYLKHVAEIATHHNVPVHMDGARLFNAAVAIREDVTTITQHVDSVQFCLSKGLGAPVGSILAGSKQFIANARKKRKMLGGGLRQAGVLAAPGLLALKSNIKRLEDDHEHARMLAAAINRYTDMVVTHDIHTNIIIADTAHSAKTAKEWVSLLAEKGISVIQYKPEALRFTTHLNISTKNINDVINLLKTCS